LRAMIMEGIGQLNYREVDRPVPEPGGILVKVDTCALCATDIKLLTYGHDAITYPHVLGHEIAGVVEEVTPGVKDLKPGDRVALAPTLPCFSCWLCSQGAYTLCGEKKIFGYHYWGGFAQYVAVSRAGVENNLVKKVPEGVNLEEAALMEPLACVIHGQEEVDVRLGDTVVVLGLGPIGCMHIAVARARGATTIIAANRSSQTRLDMAKRFPADIYVNQQERDLKEVVMKATGGRGASVVIVATPAKAALSLAQEIVAPRGRISIFGGLPKNDPVIPLDANIVHYKEVTVHGSFSASPRDCDLALKLIAAGTINTGDFITHRLPLGKVAEGMDLIRRGECLKVVIKPQWDQ